MEVFLLFHFAQLLQPPKNGMSTLFPVFGLPNLRVGGRGLHIINNYRSSYI